MSDPRLSDLSIDDHIWRVKLYRKIREYIRLGKNLSYYEVKEDEKTRPDLLAYRVYGYVDLRWLVVLVANNDDEFSPLPVGYRLSFPPIQVIRTFIREVREEYASSKV
ncbi:hypothetical protein [Vibrio europaeus]|uniref:hypothetical protein n=1 Tax=Vibrio europaeus TaxID=300876 RepID=UPI00233F2ADB|nr:hypothetical protein [Vibrio europaeus]MDC5753602.1 hypothetical protein [Vibrio europaeus]MDC5816485.1 hypothetical protein [Vibrio europaeus]